ncbi:uncharacterized protein N7498_005252 [Penicillium cinerascens]|uniref:Major facilitator superfamily (MFS) profile domain-containing protein n=1 Tax=Penicillium cinerascens TaxID=70096 RepID=A0A9W9MN79_9EURO|nr:uncharacterized protein N7498_005252 [Penicillium cinerascens]KAJ5204373.1 hypothetical protein N7498_005252 [Penicillium cinerascens]
MSNSASSSPKALVTDQKDALAETVSTEGSDMMLVYQSYDSDFRDRIERKLRRKIDTRILALVVLIYIFNFMDRNSISQAHLYGLTKDTYLKGAEYQTAISTFSAGYILMQTPATILLAKLRPSIFLPSCIMVWAIVSGCTAAVTNPTGLLVVRLFLGFVEAPFFPGSIYFLSCWYTKREIGIRMAITV